MKARHLSLGLVGLVPSLASLACGADTEAPKPAGKELAPGIYQVGAIAHPRVAESSGVVASRRHPGVCWTHTDGGGPKKQVLYALSRAGTALGEFRVVGARIEDWEDLAIDGEGRIYIGDVGNNDARREQLAVYEIDEPDPKSSRMLASVNRGWQLRFPKKPFDCEALFVWQGHGYLISKVFNDKNADLYRFPLTEQRAPQVLEKVARLPIESPVTGVDITADGRRLGVVCRSGAYLFDIGGKPDEVGTAPFQRARFKHEHIEGCCLVPDGLLTTAESREIILFTEAAFTERK
jgi:hypothetical protein